MRRAPWETATTQAEGIQLVRFIMIAVALTARYVLERTPAGRSVYATGSNPEAARLVGTDMKKTARGTSLLGGLAAAPAGVLRSPESAAGIQRSGRATCCRRSRRRSLAQPSSGEGDSTPGEPSQDRLHEPGPAQAPQNAMSQRKDTDHDPHPPRSGSQ
jgi:Branched-chain amino acid transport system / permease component